MTLFVICHRSARGDAQGAVIARADPHHSRGQTGAARPSPSCSTGWDDMSVGTGWEGVAHRENA
jgi:hypothetical protein